MLAVVPLALGRYLAFTVGKEPVDDLLYRGILERRFRHRLAVRNHERAHVRAVVGDGPLARGQFVQQCLDPIQRRFSVPLIRRAQRAVVLLAADTEADDVLARPVLLETRTRHASPPFARTAR